MIGRLEGCGWLFCGSICYNMSGSAHVCPNTLTNTLLAHVVFSSLYHSFCCLFVPSLVPRPRPLVPRPHPLVSRPCPLVSRPHPLVPRPPPSCVQTPPSCAQTSPSHKEACMRWVCWQKLRHENICSVTLRTQYKIHTRTVLTVEYKKEWSNTDNPRQTEWSTCTTRSTQMKCSGQVLNLGRIFPPLDWRELCMRAERDMDHYSHHPPRSYLTAMKTEIKSGASWISTRLRPDTKLVKFI